MGRASVLSANLGTGSTLPIEFRYNCRAKSQCWIVHRFGYGELPNKKRSCQIRMSRSFHRSISDDFHSLLLKHPRCDMKSYYLNDLMLNRSINVHFTGAKRRQKVLIVLEVPQFTWSVYFSLLSCWCLLIIIILMHHNRLVWSIVILQIFLIVEILSGVSQLKYLKYLNVKYEQDLSILLLNCRWLGSLVRNYSAS
jgi:hypothetical protein